MTGGCLAPTWLAFCPRAWRSCDRSHLADSCNLLPDRFAGQRPWPIWSAPLNLGVGMIAIVDPSVAEAATKRLNDRGILLDYGVTLPASPRLTTPITFRELRAWTAERFACWPSAS